MMTDIEMSLAKNLDAQLWKSCFHHVIERFRELDKQLTDNGDVQKCLGAVIEDVSRSTILSSSSSWPFCFQGERFFLAFIRQLESAYHIDTKFYFNPNAYPPELNTIVSKCALLCTQHCFLNLGDLAR
jgi:hypothetical protein